MSGMKAWNVRQCCCSVKLTFSLKEPFDETVLYPVGCREPSGRGAKSKSDRGCANNVDLFFGSALFDSKAGGVGVGVQ